MTHRRFVCNALVAMLVVVGLVVASGAAAQAASGTLNAPVYAGDFPDATVVLVNGTYWAYSTGSAGRNMQAMNSTDLDIWRGPSDPLPVPPSWASSGRTWAPGDVQVGTTMVMYYAVHDVALN
jgi:arabinan endo-1,5-alpha-L-arabinosidase